MKSEPMFYGVVEASQHFKTVARIGLRNDPCVDRIACAMCGAECVCSPTVRAEVVRLAAESGRELVAVCMGCLTTRASA